MKLETTIIEMLLEAESKALATGNNETLNVVPVSTMRIIDNQIILVNYFMGKTLDNITQNPHVALVCWKGLEGLQIKGSIEHLQRGKLYEDITEWVAEILPERTVKGILVLTPEEIFDISATKDRAGMKI